MKGLYIDKGRSDLCSFSASKMLYKVFKFIIPGSNHTNPESRLLIKEVPVMH